ncbi:MFS transporter [Saccharomonospora sp. NPDC046836]|uniref:MFS transporter n=1 Tax=Saccharomonospora sp. NPDC046836 TaxID=3156921 RepID=UPI0033EF8F03
MSEHQSSLQSPAGTASSTTGGSSMPRIAIASFTGSVIEFYDFFIYGIAAALVFPHIFFPALGSAAGTVASFATLGVAFVARPIGSILFGHFGDRLGRKKTLVTTLLMMGIATVLVGLMPTAGQIGVVAPICLVVLRIVQGLAAGGEWAGAVLFAAENAPREKRGFWAMFPSLGGGAALVLGNATFLLTGLGMSNETFMSWGWRIPFVASAVLIVVGLWIRLRIDETPVFATQLARRETSRLPFFEALRRQPKQILLASGMVIMVPTFTYLGSSYLTNYGASALDLPRTAVLAMGVGGGVAISLGIVVGAVLSDRVGRRRVILTGAILAVTWSLALFPIVDIGSTWAFGLGVFLTMFISGVAYGPMSALMSELFHTRYRYTAAGFSYNAAHIVGGAIPPMVAAAITAAYGGFVFGLCLAALCTVSLLCVRALAETRHYELDSDDY